MRVEGEEMIGKDRRMGREGGGGREWKDRKLGRKLGKKLGREGKDRRMEKERKRGNLKACL